MDRRDFYGYKDQRPDAKWPGGARVAINLVVNIEEGAELSLADGDPANEPMHEVTICVPMAGCGSLLPACLP